MPGAALSAVVKFHTVLPLIPAKALPDPSVNAPLSIVT